MTNETYQDVIKQKTKDGYVTAAQGRVYIDGILIDECYDIQYQYREMKEPIYGYNSKFFDAILPGTVIIMGAFTINYKHDGYLSAVLKKVSKDKSSSSKSDLLKAMSRKSNYDNEAKNYTKKLKEYKGKLDEQKDLEQKAIAYAVAINQFKLVHSQLVERTWLFEETQISIAKKQYESLRDASEPGSVSYYLELDKKIEAEITAGEFEQMEMTRDSMRSILQENPSVELAVNAYYEWQKVLNEKTAAVQRHGKAIVAAEKDLEDTLSKQESNAQKLRMIGDSIDNMYRDLQSSKSKTNEVNREISNILISNSTILNESTRAEDSPVFNIMIEYNGKFHKVIQDCAITGHAHVIGHSGEPIKEYYNFIARSIR